MGFTSAEGLQKKKYDEILVNPYCNYIASVFNPFEALSMCINYINKVIVGSTEKVNMLLNINKVIVETNSLPLPFCNVKNYTLFLETKVLVYIGLFGTENCETLPVAPSIINNNLKNVLLHSLQAEG
jgi:hypothetical protein